MLGVREAFAEGADESPQLDSLGSSPFFELHPFGRILRELVPDFKLFDFRDTCSGAALVEHFSQGLHAFARNRGARLPAWLVAACQINMDMYDIVEFNGDLEIEKLQGKI